jgi:hypothetical protein
MNYRVLLRNLVIAGSAGGAIAQIEIPEEYRWIRTVLVAVAAVALGAYQRDANGRTNKIEVPKCE